MLKQLKFLYQSLKEGAPKYHVYEVIPFYCELDMLELHLEAHKSFVDKFYVVEADYYHNGKRRVNGRFLEQVPSFLRKYPQIIYIRCNRDDIDENPVPTSVKNISKNLKQKYDIWKHEFYNRNCVKKALLTCNKDDIIISSDVDEMFDYKTFQSALDTLNTEIIAAIRHNWHMYKLNIVSRNKKWLGSRITRYEHFKRQDQTLIRELKEGYPVDGGWHFQSMYKEDDSLAYQCKLNVYSHFSDPDHGFRKNINDVEDKIQEDIKKYNCKIVDIGNNIPLYLQDNLTKFKPYLYTEN